MIFLMSFSLTLNPLIAVESIDSVDHGVVFIYTEAEHRNVIAGFEEIKLWRNGWAQYETNYNTLLDSHNVWKENYDKEAAANYDLRFQRNVMVGISGGLTVVITIVLSILGLRK